MSRHLASLGASVTATVRPGGSDWRLPDLTACATVETVDLRDHAALRRLVARVEPEYVFHAAAHSAYDPSGSLAERTADTLLSLSSLLDACAAVPPARILLLGSSLAYGPSSQAHREDDPPHPTSLRGALKAASSLVAFAHSREHELSLTELRLFSVYGPWEPLYRLIPRAIAAGLRGEVLPLTSSGPRRDFVFVEDVARACALAAMSKRAHGQIINVGSGHEVSNEDLVAAVAKVLDTPVRIEPGSYPLRHTDTAHWRADLSRARTLLDWSPEHSLERGLAITAAWFRGALQRGADPWLRAGLEVGTELSRG